jgi:hypothetical protein
MIAEAEEPAKSILVHPHLSAGTQSRFIESGFRMEIPGSALFSELATVRSGSPRSS